MEQHTSIIGTDLIIPLDDATELRPACLQDAEEFFAVIDRNRERLHHWLAWSSRGYSLDDTRRFLADAVVEGARGESLTMAILYEGGIVGAIALHKMEKRNRTSSIGYWLDGDFEGKGIVTAACRAMITEGFRRYGLHRIEIRCATANHRSSAIPRRLEFLEEGILREAEWVHDRWLDLRVFSMLAQDWDKSL